MRKVPVSDDPNEIWLSPERVRAARGLLNWTQRDLAKAVAAVGVTIEEIRLFEDFGVLLDVHADSAIKRVLLPKIEFTITEGEPGVVRKRPVGLALGPGELVFGGRLERRPKL